MHQQRLALVMVFLAACSGAGTAGEEFRPLPLKSTISRVQPMTGIVLWNTNPRVDDAPIQLEYLYLRYDQVVSRKGVYDWQVVEKALCEIASRKHQAIIRWHDTYVAKPTGVPAYIKALPDYRETNAKSENQLTGFPDWSHPELRSFVLEFFTRFTEKYDRDRRLAFVQVGFGLWAEYHIYDGPMELGKTFPSKEFQREFFQHLGKQFKETSWMVSVDAGDDYCPLAADPKLLALRFGLFDDSFNHAKHKLYNEPNWTTVGRDRWKSSPGGGEFSFFEKKDQQQALAPRGPHGISFEEQAAKFHISFMIGDGQPRVQKDERIREAGQACGYRFEVIEFSVTPDKALVVIRNNGIAPLYYDAFPAIDGTRSVTSLRGLLPGESRAFKIAAGGDQPRLTIECDRLVAGQSIEFDADLP